MRLIVSIVTVTALTAILPAQAQQRREGAAPAPLAISDPLKAIYRISGITDSGSPASAGTATVIHCTSFSTVLENVKFLTRDNFGTQVGNVTVSFAPNQTISASTHPTAAFFDGAALVPTGTVLNQGSTVIQATTLNIHCSPMIIDAGLNPPQGIALHPIRINPLANTQE